MSAFGDELRRLRQRAGMSQELLASRAGLSPEAVSLLERGRRSPRMTTMRLLADAMQLDGATRQELFDSQIRDEPGPSRPPAYPSLALAPPRFLDDLVGRDVELDQLCTMLDRADGRLITITGPGGVGKTRLAAEATARLQPSVSEGLRWMIMASVVDGAALLPAVAAALGVRLQARDPASTLVEALADRQLLLVMDGAEHVLDPLRDLAVQLVAGCPHLSILVTSTHRLQVAGETTIVLAPLATPDSNVGPSGLSASPAARLFLDRAGLTSGLSTSGLSAEEAAAVARICRRLDGLPLALELAAARTQVLSVVELAAALDRTLGILRPSADGRDDLTERVVGWTYRLLKPEEQQILQRMTTFTSFTHESLAAVCADRWDSVEVLDMITSLLNKSLVARFARNEERSRFMLFEVVRVYAADRLSEADAIEARRRHATYFRDLVISAEPHLTAADQTEWLSLLDREVSNIRLAIDWLADHDPESALRLVAALWRWCYLRGRYAEGRRWMAKALEADPSVSGRHRAPALAGAGMLAFLQCDYAEAQLQIEAALTVYRELNDPVREAWCLTRLGSIARERGQYEKAETLHRQALGIAKETGDEHEIGAALNYLAFVAWLRGDLDAAEQLGAEALGTLRRTGDDEALVWALVNTGVTARYRGDLPSAELLLQQALRLSEQVDFREGIAWTQNQLGVVARLSGQYTTARRLQTASLAEHNRLGDRWRMASVLDELAAIAVATGDYRDAAANLGVADRLRADIGTPVPTAERTDRDAVVAATSKALGSAYRASLLAGSLRSAAMAGADG